MQYEIGIHQYELSLKIGCHPGERIHAQPVFYDATLLVESVANETDNIDDAPNYFSLTESIRDSVSGTEYALLERLAVEIRDYFLSDTRIMSARVSVFKPKALPHAQTVSVTVS
jgi:dihydroneopterin aldolase